MPTHYKTFETIKDSLVGFEGDFGHVVIVEKHDDYPEGLVFQNLKQTEFNSRYEDFVSRYSMLSEVFLLNAFVKQLEEDGFTVVFLDSCRQVLDNIERWSQELKVENFHIKGGFDLHDYQQFSLNKALERAELPTAKERMFFFGLGAGSGKSFISAAGAQELFNRGKIDLVIAFTMRKLKINLCRNFNDSTALRAKIVDGTKEKRIEEYEAGDFDVLVTNYEKCFFDFGEMMKLVKGKRVLYVNDETQKILRGENSATKARTHLDKLVKASDAIVWPMSASVVSQTPLRYYDLFSLHGKPRDNILGPKYKFEERYIESKYSMTLYNKNGGRFNKDFLTWDIDKLQELRHRVSPQVQSVRKTDPGVRDNFKGMQTLIVPIQMSSQDRKLYDIVSKEAEEVLESGFNIVEYVRILGYICNSPEVLQFSESEIAQRIVKEHPELINSKNSSKMEVFLDQIDAIADAGEKVVAFTQYTNLTLFTLEKELKKRKIKFVTHYGTGMTDKEAQKAQDDFKAKDDITLFLSSDAGSHGLSFQEAKYVINYDTPYSYDVIMQRGDRINRVDSYLDGLTAYVYITENTIEERIWKINNSRRKLASATQGTKETLNTKRNAIDDLSQESDDSFLLNRFALLGENSLVSNQISG